MITFSCLTLAVCYAILFGNCKSIDWDEMPLYMVFALLEAMSLDMFIYWLVKG
jgi:hypothetical protein